jgi:nitrogen fixation protein FixH
MSPTQLVTHKPAETGKLTGLHVLAMLTAFFGVMFVANGFLVYYALGTFSGTVTDSSYQASQAFNIYIAAARAQQLRDWNVTADARRLPSGEVTIRVDARDADNVPIADVDFAVTLQRPTSRREDRSVPLVADVNTPGIFTGTAAGIAAGQWDVVIAADTDTSLRNEALRSNDDVGAAKFRPHLFKSVNRVVFR